MMMIDEDGDEVLAVYDYFPYGKKIVEMAGGEKTETHTFTGKELDRYDEEVAVNDDGEGYYYFPARYYDAEIGGFISTDPIGEFWNAYAYTRGNPILFIDPNGIKEYPADFIGPLQQQDWRAGDAIGLQMAQEFIASDIRANGWFTFMDYVLDPDYGTDFFTNPARNITVTGLESMLGSDVRFATQLGEYLRQPTMFQSDNTLQHQIGSFLLSNEIGFTKANIFLTGNEVVRGLYIDARRGRLWQAFTGQGGTAFEYNDLRNNGIGMMSAYWYQQGIYNR